VLECDLRDPHTRLALNLAVEMAEMLQHLPAEED
jgi:DNA-binding PucR family transcriptional regulator